MLEQLLSYLRQGGTTSVQALARQFKVSETLMEQMLVELTRLGYLSSLGTCSSTACEGCRQSTACGTRRPVQTWVYQERAK